MAGEGGNIVRNVFGKSYKEAEQIMKDASKGTLDFKSPQENTFYGKKGGKKFDEYQAKKETLPVRVLKVKCYEDFACTKEVTVIEKERKYFYKVTQYNRTPTKAEVKNLKWAIQYDDGSISNAMQVTGEEKISFFVSDNSQVMRVRVFAFFKTPNKNASIEVFTKHIELEITDKSVGYSIMRLFDVADDFTTTMLKDKFPACIVNVYSVTIKYYEGNEVVEHGSFGVTRDGWQKIDEKDGKYFMINRAFEPKESNQNTYKVAHSFVPSQYKGLMKIDAFELHSFAGKANLPAEPIYTNYKLDNKTPITHSRNKIDEVTNVNIHIGGHYTRGRTMKRPVEVQYSSPTTGIPTGTSYKIEEVGIHWLGGSLGCFAFVEPEDIKPDIKSAFAAHNNNEYSKHTSNRPWQNIVDKIHKLEAEYKAQIIVKVVKRSNYKKVIPDFDPKSILWE
ncbi:hypothetical protein [Chryseobacterium sp. 'Rf worker isolate 10']|uniref:hypothetical protein n=1 Tax=Chryseobacterium sp. 'Rf worker isolate 10' TaxID=2887348 RepID=UPI003D6E7939